MPFAPQNLNNNLLADVNNFVANNNFPELYRSYSWERDTYAAGFPDILALELQLSESERTTGVTLEDVRTVARWGNLRNQQRIAGPDPVIPANTLTQNNGAPQPNLLGHPHDPMNMLNLVTGLGPTYQSKVLRFALPAEYGAIDTRVVRVFGQGDAGSRRHDWLNVSATQGMYQRRPTSWYIPAAQGNWPNGFAVWTNILRHIATVLLPNCPHPQSFVEEGIRQQGEWSCADVEMALFTYASRHV